MPRKQTPRRPRATHKVSGLIPDRAELLEERPLSMHVQFSGPVTFYTMPLPPGYVHEAAVTTVPSKMRQRGPEHRRSRRAYEQGTAPDPKRVFVVYGRNGKALAAMRLFLRALKLEPLDFDTVKDELGGSPFIGEIIRRGMERAQAIVVLFTPDEYTALRPELWNVHDVTSDKVRWQPRPNVIFEAGMALAIDERRTILAVFGGVSLSSDLHGRYFLTLNNSVATRNALRNALIGTGCEVDPFVRDLETPEIAGDFEACLKPPVLKRVRPLAPFRTTRK